ncbi:MAG: glutamate-1-semialdehyde-2,1-aminomutase [Planctomycetota bacterium]|nr:MAG: glutamate-1-semialdehyde-2,1-aminomutase [Planctomycetota bacterium]
MKREKSIAAFEEARKYLPGGVNSPVRAFGAVGGNPLFIDRASGSRIIDIDGNEYIDYVCSWGPLILGHCDADVLQAVGKALQCGASFGAPTRLETELAGLIVEMVPSIRKVRMVNSGTEATMSAIRLARGYTSRDLVIKFDGCYHGHVDGLLVKAGSGPTTFGHPTSPGVPRDFAKNTVSVPYNDIDSFRKAVEKFRGDIACAIVEPVAGNMGVVPPEPGFLEGLREVTVREGIVLIFDEVITGFRLGPGGAQERYNIQPDLTTLGKIIGGGLPVGAYGGVPHIMDRVSPVGSVYQAGTLSGNPPAMAAGIATLKKLREPGFYEGLETKAARLEEGLKDVAKKSGVACCINRVGSMLCTFFTGEAVKDYRSAGEADAERYARYFTMMLEEGIYLAPSQFEAMFVSAAHSDEDIDRTIEAAARVFARLKSS